LGYAKPGDEGKKIRCGSEPINSPGIRKAIRRAKERRGKKSSAVKGCLTEVTITAAHVKQDEQLKRYRDEQYIEALKTTPGTPVPEQMQTPSAFP
jgi:hypothetical protein